VSRTVNLVLVDATGALLGALPAFDVASPWWQEVDDLLPAVRARHGIDIQVLRLLHGVGVDRPAAGGEVTYLAELSGSPELALAGADVDLSPQPHRAAYAKPGGPAASIGWGTTALTALGTPGATALQQRTWNLSAIWRFDADGAPVAWLKQVPSFFGHEPAVLGLVSGVAPGLVPPLLAAGDEGRMLLAHVPGEDGYGAGAGVCADVAIGFHPVQAHFAGRVGDLLAAGLPDRRLSAEPFARSAEPYHDGICGLGELVEGLPARLAQVAECGLPDTLVHGDLHPGNTRIGSGPPVIMDWGDAVVSHPAYDILRLTEALPPADGEALIAAWALRWRLSVPGSDPARAVELMRPVQHLRGAVIYRDFVAAIEPAEQIYHRDDIAGALTAAVRAATVT
jgi:Phosphotransferase enzyme family